MDDELEKLNLPSVPGPPRAVSQDRPPKVYPRLNAKLRIFMWCAILGGPVLLAMGGYEAYRARKLKLTGKQVAGKVVSADVIHGPNAQRTHQLTVDYLPPGSKIKYRKQFAVDEKVYAESKESGDCMVTYLESEPTFSSVGDASSKASEMLAMGGGIFIIGVGVRWLLRRQQQAVIRYVTKDVSPA
jgi:hypothetical protein